MIFFVADLFVEQYEGGAELTTEALCQSSLLPINKIIASTLTVSFMKRKFKEYDELKKELEDIKKK